MSNHWLIAIATSEYANLPKADARPQLDQSLSDVVEMFTKTIGNYRRQLDEISRNPTVNTLKSELDAWFASDHRDPSDWVVVYYTGHADLVGNDKLYLLTSDYKPGQYVSTAFSFDLFADLLVAPRASGEPRRTRNLLLILDTCFAEQGAGNLANDLRSLFQHRGGGAFYMLSAALSRQEAQAGALALALTESVNDLSTRNVRQQWLYLEQIVPEINQRLKVSDAIWSGVGTPKEEPRFFPNPKYVDTYGQAITADVSRRAIADEDFRQHWSPRSRGVEFDHQPGEYFVGRDAVLRELTAYLGDWSDRRVHVVTGGAGTGKSAILSRIVAASRSEDVEGTPARTRIDLALHARGRSLEDIRGRFAEAFGISATTDAILRDLADRDRPMRIVLDALDEAAEPQRILTELLLPIASSPMLNLIVGTRRPSHAAAFSGARTINLDDADYAPVKDLERYVGARLLRSQESDKTTPYSGHEEVAGRIANAIALRASPNFLVARLIVEFLLSHDRAIDTDSPTALNFPGLVSDAFELYLTRFGSAEDKVRDILLPLAYSEGQGLPWDNVWARVASALAGREYSNGDVRDVLSLAGAFILEATENARTVYRLYHQALADSLREQRKALDVHRTFATELRALTPTRADAPSPDWFLASRYTRTHLATHAGAAGMLAELLGDPLYLLAADPTRLTQAIALYRNQLPNDVVAVYEETFDQIFHDDVATACAYLELHARQRHNDALARRISALPIERPWTTLWAQWRPGDPHRPFGRQDAIITAATVATWVGERVVAVVGRDNGAVEVWDIASAECIVSWSAHDWSRDSVAVTAVDLLDGPDGAWLVAMWESAGAGSGSGQKEFLGRLDLRSRDAKFIKCPRGTALCVFVNEGSSLCVVAQTNSLISLRLSTFEQVAQRSKASPSTIYVLRVFKSGDLTVLASGGDALYTHADKRARSVFRLWTPDSLEPLWADRRGDRGIAFHLDVGCVRERTVAIVSQDAYGPTRIWDLQDRRVLYEAGHASNRSWLIEEKNGTFLIDIFSGVARVASCTSDTSGRLAVGPFSGGSRADGIDLGANRFSMPFRLHGRNTLLGFAHDIRVIDVADVIERLQNSDRDDKSSVDENDISSAAYHDETVVVGAVGVVSSRSAETGLVEWAIAVRDTEPRRVAALDINVRRRQVIVGARNAEVRVLALDNGEQIQTMSVGSNLLRLASCELDGNPAIAVATEHGRSWSVRLWALEDAHELATGAEYGLSSGQEDKEMRGLAIRPTQSGIDFAFSSKYGKVMIAQYPRADTPGRPFRQCHVGERGEYINVLAISTIASGDVLAIGSEYGKLGLWRFPEMEMIAETTQPSEVSDLGFGVLANETVLATGGRDGFLRFFAIHSLQERYRIQIGSPIGCVTWLGPNRVFVGTFRGGAALRILSSSLRKKSEQRPAVGLASGRLLMDYPASISAG